MSVQATDFTPFKLLLKQVYSSHTSRVKELENEVKSLRMQLSEKANVSEKTSDCKRCAELEAAFKSCKKALQEQSKLFETFGQKFSIFNGTESGTQEFRVSSKPLPDVTSEKILPNAESTLESHDSKSSIASVNGKLGEKVHDNAMKNMVPSNKDLLKKFICDGSTFDVCSVNFPAQGEDSNKNCDNTIFAPDSLEVTSNVQRNPSTKHSPKNTENTILSGNLGKNKVVVAKSSVKRLSSESLEEERQMKQQKNNSQEDIDVTVVPKQSVTNSVYSKNVTIKTVYPNSLEKKRTNLNEGKTLQDVEKTKSISLLKLDCVSDLDFETAHKNLSPDWLNKESTKQGGKSNCVEDFEILNVVAGSKEVFAKEKNTTDLDTKKLQLSKTDKNVDISSCKSSVTPKTSSCLSLVSEVKKNNSPYETSPSLLPKPASIVPKAVEIEQVLNDNDDFIDSNLNSKLLQCEDSWDISDKRKTVKKGKIMKSVKCTSKYKMTLDAPPLDYKKPTYKQSKLSKSFFQGKANFNAKLTKTLTEKNMNNELETHASEKFHTSTPYVEIGSQSPIDIDATFIPENYQFDISPQGTALVKRNTVEKSNLKNGSLFSDISFPDGMKGRSKHGASKDDDIFVEEIENSPSFEEDELQENMNSFDRIPVKEEPNYKYKNDVVRKKVERKQLNGFDCKECEKYYSDLGLSEKEKKERMKKCSRHRAKFAPSNTPDNFWELDFPDTEECKARGYTNVTQKVKLNQLCDL